MEKGTTNIVAEEMIVWSILEKVSDPEIPVLSVVDLGIIRELEIIQPGEKIVVCITPTYSGCPAMDVISTNIRLALLSHGYHDVGIRNILSPAWTTEWMSDAGKAKLKDFGIAPPGLRGQHSPELFAQSEKVACPLCNSGNTHMLSEFGSTSCKALYQCDDCKEPFDVFKCH